MSSPKSKKIKPKIQKSKGLLTLSATTLLDRFGAGRPVPGAGSAAAFSGLLGANLAITVIKLTLKRKDYKSSHTELTLIKDDIEKNILSRLVALIDEDSNIFNQVIQARRKRNNEGSAFLFKKYQEEALALQRRATTVPLELGELCVTLARHSRRIYDIGRKSVRGDSGAAFSQSISGATAALFVVLLNLRDFKQSKWKRDLLEKCEGIYKELLTLQSDLFKRMRGLKPTEPKQALIQQTSVFHLLESIPESIFSNRTGQKQPAKTSD